MSTYYASFTDDGLGNFTVTAQRGGTAPSAGTALSIPHVESTQYTAGLTKTKLIGVAVEAAKRAIVNDRAAGN